MDAEIFYLENNDVIVMSNRHTKIQSDVFGEI